MPEPFVRPETDDATEMNREPAGQEWVTPEIVKIELETAQQTGGIPG